MKGYSAVWKKFRPWQELRELTARNLQAMAPDDKPQPANRWIRDLSLPHNNTKAHITCSVDLVSPLSLALQTPHQAP